MIHNSLTFNDVVARKMQIRATGTRHDDWWRWGMENGVLVLHLSSRWVSK